MQAWRDASHVKGTLGEQATFTVLQQALKRIGEASEDTWAKWTINCGRNVANHSGPVPFARSMRLVRSLPLAAKSQLRLGKSKRPYALNRQALVVCYHFSRCNLRQVQPFVFCWRSTKNKPPTNHHTQTQTYAHTCMTRYDTDVAKKVIKAHVQLGCAMLKIDAPDTLDKWSQSAKSLLHECQQTPAFDGANKKCSYRQLWFVRTWLSMLMHRNGIKRLKLSSDVTMPQLAQLFPDQGNWLTKFGTGHQSVKEMFTELAYDGPVEFFTMYCCLFASQELRKLVQVLGGNFLAEHVAELRVLRMEFEDKSGQTPHPFVLLSTFVKAKVAVRTHVHTYTVYSERYTAINILQYLAIYSKIHQYVAIHSNI